MGLISNVVSGITGSGAASAASSGGRKLSQAALEAADLRTEGAGIRAEGGQKGLDFLTDKLNPFASQFGADDLASINALATDANAQVDFLSNNPLFEALKNQAREATFNTQSASGMLGSTGTDEILQNKFLAQGNDLINQQINRQLPLLQSAQSASTGLGTGGANLLAQIANANASGLDFQASGLEDSAQALTSGQIGAQNARDAGAANILSLGTSLASMFSDSQLKENIVKIGEHEGLNTYSWTWNDAANDLGLSGDSHGHIAQEVKEIHPELVEMTSTGYLAINYGTDKTVSI